MMRYKKLTLACLAIIIIGTLDGCGTTTNGGKLTTNFTRSIANAASNITTIATMPTQSTNTNSMLSISVPLTTGQVQPSTMSLKVPEGWMEQRVGQGSTLGYTWVNPSDVNQQIQLITLSNIASFQDAKSNQWDVTQIFGSSKNVSWTNVSSDKLTARFTDASGVNRFATNVQSQQTPYTGYGESFIVQHPNPFAVYIEVWGTQGLASTVISSVQLQQ